MDTPNAAPPRHLTLIIVLGCAQIVSWGTFYYAISLLIPDLAQAAHTEPAVVVGAFSWAMLVAGLASSPVGAWIDRHGGRGMMVAGSIGGGLLLAALSQVASVWALYAVWTGIGLAMAASLYDPAFAVLGQVFKERQRGAITALTLFGGLASTVFWPTTQALIEAQGWRGALGVLAAIQVLGCAPLLAWAIPARAGDTPLLLADGARPPSAAPAQRSALREVLRDPDFYWLCASFIGNAMVFSAMSVHMIALLQDKGLSTSQAAWVGALIGPMQVMGRLLEYLFFSRLKASRVGSVAMWLLPVSLALLAAGATQSWMFGLFALLYGSGNGVMTIVRGALPAEMYGRAHYGAVNGAMAMPVLVAKSAGPLAASWVMSWTLTPAGLFPWLIGLAAVSAALFSGVVWHQGRRRPLDHEED